MKTLGLILASLLALGIFATRAAAATASADTASEICNPIAATPQHRYRRFRRHYWHHRRHQQVSPTPEPATMTLLGLGGLGLAYSSRRRKRKQALLQQR